MHALASQCCRRWLGCLKVAYTFYAYVTALRCFCGSFVPNVCIWVWNWFHTVLGHKLKKNRSQAQRYAFKSATPGAYLSTCVEELYLQAT